MEKELPRLDILIYAHDGRGLGHVSRSAAIGMAVRRLFRELKVCLITGCPQTGELIGDSSLDWLKLPAYRTEVVNGSSRGVDGLSGYSDSELGFIRAEQIRQTVELYCPRLVLADHTPQGKHKELVPALESSTAKGTKWLLGVRGVVGNVVQTASSLARELYGDYYSGLFWYGDSKILGKDHRNVLAKQFNTELHECGYVSRLSELSFVSGKKAESRHDCTISIPWVGEGTVGFLENFAAVMERVKPVNGTFALFLGEGVPAGLYEFFQDKEWCRVEPFGSNYAGVLSNSRTAVVFGGYNSLVDVLSFGIPTLVITRSMQDGEQQEHLDRLCLHSELLFAVEEKNCSETVLEAKLKTLLSMQRAGASTNINLDGAETTAGYLFSLLQQAADGG